MLRFSFFLLKSAFSLAGTGRALPFQNAKRCDSIPGESHLFDSWHLLIFSSMPPFPTLRILGRPDALAAYGARWRRHQAGLAPPPPWP